MSQMTEPTNHQAKSNPDIDSVTSLKLYEGKRVKHELIYGVVKSRNTGLFHHDYANFKTYRKRKNQPWKLDPAASFTLSEDREGALTEALLFLKKVREQTQAKTESSQSLKTETEVKDMPAQASLSGEVDSLQLWQSIAGLNPAQQMELSLHVFEGLKQTMPLAECVSLLQSSVQADHLQDAQELFQVAQWRSALSDLKQLLKTQAATGVLAEFVKQQAWVLGRNALELSKHKSNDPQQTSLQVLQFLDPYGDLTLGLAPQDISLFESASDHQLLPSKAFRQVITDFQQHLISLAAEPDPMTRPRILLIIGSTLDPASIKALSRFNQLFSEIEIMAYQDLVVRAAKLLKNLQARVKSRQTKG